MSEPLEWTAHYDDAGELYYYNDKSGESSWEEPKEGFNPAETEVEAPTSEGDVEKKKKWVKHTDDDGAEYYYNEESGETQWDKPEDYIEEDGDDEKKDEGDDAAAPESAAEPAEPEEKAEEKPEEKAEAKADDVADAASSDAAVPNAESAAALEEAESAAAAADATVKKNKWTKHTDDDGQEYYYNEESGDTQWDEPDDYKEEEEKDEPAAAAEVAEVAAPTEDEKPASEKKWTKHTDDDGRIYYYNEESGDTQWDAPEGFVETADEGKEDDDDNKPPDAAAAKGKKNWTKHTNDDGQEYYYDEVSGETQWDKPDDYEAADGDDSSSPVRPSSPIVQDDDGDSPDRPKSPSAAAVEWTKHTDDEGRQYYYNEASGETQWEAPAGFKDTTIAAVVVAAKWTKHTDEEGREYYFNEATQETQWEAPADYQEETTMTTAAEGDKKETAKEQDDDDEVMKEKDEEPEAEPEAEIDPAVKRLQDAENALNNPDAIMEPNCLDNVGVLIASLGGNEGGGKAMQSLVTSFQGETAICGLLGLWLSDLKAVDEDAPKAASHVRDSVEEVVNKIAKERFTKAGGDNIFQLKKAEAGFLEEMMDSSLWRKLLIDLSATHRDSTLLSYCLSSISKRGHHREIAKRINQSDHFPVYTAMLASEFTVVGNGGEAMGMNELLDDLRRTCTSTSYTYLYAVEVLRHLVHTAEEKASSDKLLIQAIRKWTRLREELEAAMVDPTVSAKTAGSSSLYRKRRRDVALTVSELHQRQRRRLRPGMEESNGNLRDEQQDSLEQALSTLLLRHAESKQFDDKLLDNVLSSGSNPKEIGRLLNSHPLAVKALLGHLFLPGSLRASSPTTLGKCARLVALAVLAAESATKTERGFEDPSARQAKEEDIKGMLLTGSQACVIVENMVSFTVTSDIEMKESSSSAGIKLSVLANKSAPVAQGVVMWAKEMVSGNEFLTSASYPTISPSVLSLLRIISTRHAFTRPSILEVALMFLGHSNSELTYEKMNEIKEQALRLLLFLLVQGEVCAVLGSVASRLKKGDFLDASLVRYFLGGVLDVISPPCSPLMVQALGSLLLTPKCADALKSTYFSEKKTKLKTLLSMIQHGLPDTKKELKTMTVSLLKTYA